MSISLPITGYCDILANIGDSFQRLFTWTDENSSPVNLTGFTGEMQVTGPSPSTTVLVSLTTANGGLVLGGTAGTISVTVLPAVTENWVKGHYQYDLFLTSSGGIVYRLIAGSFFVQNRYSS